ncbi:MAG: site-2 protease family protein [Thermoanaerobaculia bacterium]
MAPAPRRAGSWKLATLLFLLTLFTATTMGGGFYLSTRTDFVAPEGTLWLPSAIPLVWSDGGLLAWGLAFAVPTLFILACHEFGHYWTCRRYGLPATPPYFLPAPVGLGTFGAFIRIQAPIGRKRVLFDVGISGPLAGFAALLPFLVYGIAHSSYAALGPAAAGPGPQLALRLPGECLLVRGLALGLLGPAPQGASVNLHPFALAAWVGIFATMLNLLPLGQLDGGHILYAVFGRRVRALRWPLWAALLGGGFFWPGWWMWSAILLLLGLRHPPVLDEREPLDRRRRLLAVAALVLFLVCFLPVPIRVVPYSPI